MSIRERLGAWNRFPRSFPQDPPHCAPRFSACAASVNDCRLVVEITEDSLAPAVETTFRAGAQFTSVLELASHTPRGVQRGRQTLWTVESAICETHADRSGRASARLILPSPSLALIAALVPTEPDTEIMLVRARWTELLVSDAERGLTRRVPGCWTVFEAPAREPAIAAVGR